MFHCLARCAADVLIGGAGADRNNPAWLQVYRALDHKHAAAMCKDNSALRRFPQSIEDFGNNFVLMQIKRHSADYDPSKKYNKSSIMQDIAETEEILNRFQQAPIKDRRTFAAFVLFRRRR